MTNRPSALEVGPIELDVAAPAELVYQMLAAIGQGAQRPDDRAEILERNGDALVAAFWTRARLPLGLSRVVRTLESVAFSPPNRIDYEHLDGPVRGLRESITVEPLDAHRCHLVYLGYYTPRGVSGSALFRLLSRPAVEGAVRAHFADFRLRAEARAARSRMFPAAPAGIGQ